MSVSDFVNIGAWDLTGATATRFQDIAGTTEATDKVGRVVNLLSSGVDLYAPDNTRRLAAIDGYALGDATDQGGLITDVFEAIAQPIYFAIRFTFDASTVNGHHLLTALINGGKTLLASDDGAEDFVVFETNGDEIPGVDVGAGDHVLELRLGGTGNAWALDGGAWQNSSVSNYTGSLTRIAISHNLGGALDSTSKRWRGRIYRVFATTGEPSENQRAQVRAWLNGGDFDTVPTEDEEIWNANFADASGAPPQTTALIRASDTQALADHNVLQFINGPRWYELRVWVGLGEVDDFKPGTVRSFRATFPGLENGKKLMIFERDGPIRPGFNTLLCRG